MPFALVLPAQAAMVLVVCALPRFLCSVLVDGLNAALCPNPAVKRIAFGNRLLCTLAHSKIALFAPMVFSPAFTFSSAYLQVFCHVQDFASSGPAGFKPFLAASACLASAASYFFCTSTLLRWRSLFSWVTPVFKPERLLPAFGSNSAVKRTCLRQAAYFRTCLRQAAYFVC